MSYGEIAWKISQSTIGKGLFYMCDKLWKLVGAHAADVSDGAALGTKSVPLLKKIYLIIFIHYL
jgi:hypothetical protein